MSQLTNTVERDNLNTFSAEHGHHKTNVLFFLYHSISQKNPKKPLYLVMNSCNAFLYIYVVIVFVDFP